MKNKHPQGAQYITNNNIPTFYKYNKYNVLVFWSTSFKEWKASNLKQYQKESLIKL